MPVKFTMGHPVLRAWALYHQTYNLLYRCEEVMFSKVGLTPQKYMVLMAIRLIEEPVTVSDVAQWLDRNTNSVSLIVDRMKKDGLVARTRSLGDRRTVRLSLTQKGKEKLDQANIPGWDLIHEMMTPLSGKDLNTEKYLIGIWFGLKFCLQDRFGDFRFNNRFEFRFGFFHLTCRL